MKTYAKIVLAGVLSAALALTLGCGSANPVDAIHTDAEMTTISLKLGLQGGGGALLAPQRSPDDPTTSDPPPPDDGETWIGPEPDEWWPDGTLPPEFEILPAPEFLYIDIVRVEVISDPEDEWVTIWEGNVSLGLTDDGVADLVLDVEVEADLYQGIRVTYYDDFNYVIPEPPDPGVWTNWEPDEPWVIEPPEDPVPPPTEPGEEPPVGGTEPGSDGDPDDTWTDGGWIDDPEIPDIWDVPGESEWEVYGEPWERPALVIIYATAAVIEEKLGLEENEVPGVIRVLDRAIDIREGMANVLRILLDVSAVIYCPIDFYAEGIDPSDPTTFEEIGIAPPAPGDLYLDWIETDE